MLKNKKVIPHQVINAPLILVNKLKPVFRSETSGDDCDESLCVMPLSAAARAPLPIKSLCECQPDLVVEPGDTPPEDRKIESPFPFYGEEEELSKLCISERESEAKSLEDVDNDWLACAGELSYLVEDIRMAWEFLHEVKRGACP